MCLFPLLKLGSVRSWTIWTRDGKGIWGFLIDDCLYFEEHIQNVEKKRIFVNFTLETSLSLCMKLIGLLFVVL